VTTALLQSVVLVMPLAYAGDDGDEGGSQTDITQDVKQKQKCKVGNFVILRIQHRLQHLDSAINRDKTTLLEEVLLGAQVFLSAN
jgi:hypothetical protein